MAMPRITCVQNLPHHSHLVCVQEQATRREVCRYRRQGEDRKLFDGKSADGKSDGDVGKIVHVQGDDVHLDGKPLRVVWGDDNHTRYTRYHTGKIKSVSTDKVHLENGQWFGNPPRIYCTDRSRSRSSSYRKKAWPCCPVEPANLGTRECVMSAINVQTSNSLAKNKDLGDNAGATELVADWITIRGMRKVCIPITLLCLMPDV